MFSPVFQDNSWHIPKPTSPTPGLRRRRRRPGSAQRIAAWSAGEPRAQLLQFALEILELAAAVIQQDLAGDQSSNGFER